jgi:hypothetical protein
MDIMFTLFGVCSAMDLILQVNQKYYSEVPSVAAESPLGAVMNWSAVSFYFCLKNA